MQTTYVLTKLEKLLDATYPQGDILKVSPEVLGPEISRTVHTVQQKVDELREAIRAAEDAIQIRKGELL